VDRRSVAPEQGLANAVEIDDDGVFRISAAVGDVVGLANRPSSGMVAASRRFATFASGKQP